MHFSTGKPQTLLHTAARDRMALGDLHQPKYIVGLNFYGNDVRDKKGPGVREQSYAVPFWSAPTSNSVVEGGAMRQWDNNFTLDQDPALQRRAAFWCGVLREEYLNLRPRWNAFVPYATEAYGVNIAELGSLKKM